METVLRSLGLALWGAVLLQSSLAGRLDLLLRADFHPLVWGSGVLLLGLALLDLGLTLGGRRARSGRPVAGERRRQLVWLLAAGAAVAVLALPPNPSFANLAANRPSEQLEEPELSFVLPPAERSLTDWVRLLRSQPDPALHDGDPVRISGFVLPQPGDRPQLARLLVRCCLADATPVGLAVRWPQGRQPRADQWLELQGVMAVERHGDQLRNVVIPRRITPIRRPARPLEP